MTGGQAVGPPCDPGTPTAAVPPVPIPAAIAAMSSRGLNRSLSFTGLFTPRNSPSPTSPCGTPVLGEGYRKSPMIPNRRSVGSLGFSFKKTHKMPDKPRPSRTFLMFTSVKGGLRECIKATDEDIEALRMTENEPAFAALGQVKAAERYRKRLESHLTKLEELEESYMLQQQLLEGVRNMAKAYVSLPGNHQKESLINVKCGYKECKQTMCAIEAQLESMLGTFHCQMKGMAGFARVIPGDVFEVTVRHGHQKWKSKGRIGTGHHQTWDNDTMIYRAMVGEVLAIKATELRGLGKTVVLGQKNCETKDLFSSHPQLMTVNINAIGSLKLSLIITWIPLEGVDESMSLYDPPPRSGSTPKHRLLVSPVLEEHPRTSFGDVEGVRRVELRSRSSPEYLNSPLKESRLSMPPTPTSSQGSTRFEPRFEGRGRPNSVALMSPLNQSLAATSNTDSAGSDLNAQKPQLFGMRLLLDSLDSPSPCRPPDGGNLEEALHSLSSALEDYQGHYPELQKLEQQVSHLDRILKKNRGAGSGRCSDVSISIENALGAFDFLESEDYLDGYGSQGVSRRSSFDQLDASCTLSPESTTKTADSGIESLANRLSDDQNLGSSSIGSSPEPASTGSEQVDLALLWHLSYCERLLENLGTFGPLKCREIYSVDKLSRQADLLESLIHLAMTGPHIMDLHQVLTDLTDKHEVKHFWIKCVDNVVLYTNAERFLAQVERSYGNMIREKYDISASKVFRVFVARILDVPLFDPEMKPGQSVTLHQLMSFFKEEELDLGDFLQTLSGELWISSRLRAGNTDIIIKTMLTFRTTLPPAECLQVVALLLITENPEVRSAAVSYLQGLAIKPSLRDKAMVIFVEALEDRNADVRCAACLALKHLKEVEGEPRSAIECIDQLVYVSHTDNSRIVKVKAKEALISFGEDGRKAYEDAQLTSHGFQGLNVNPRGFNVRL